MYNFVVHQNSALNSAWIRGMTSPRLCRVWCCFFSFWCVQPEGPSENTPQFSTLLFIFQYISCVVLLNSLSFFFLGCGNVYDCILLTNHLCHTYKRSHFFSLRWFCLQTVLSTIDSLMLYQMSAGLEKAQWLYRYQGWRTWMTIAWRCQS